MRSLTIALILIAAVAASAEAPSARLTFYLGDVDVWDGSAWADAQLNATLVEGQRVKTGPESRAELTLPDKSVVRVDERSEVAISDLSTGDGQRAAASLGFGRMWARVMGVVGAGSFTAETPTAVAAIRGTTFRIDYAADSTFTMFVYDGVIEVKPPTSQAGVQRGGIWGAPTEVTGPDRVPGPGEVTMEEWVEIVRQYQVCTVRPRGRPTVADFDAAADRLLEWVQWNESRDATLGW